MPVSETILMNSVVYVIVEDSVREEITICSALLRSVLRIDCNEHQYEAELLDKCSNHPSGAKITISQRNIFRTHDECNAVLHDRSNMFTFFKEYEHYKNIVKQIQTCYDEEFMPMNKHNKKT